MVPRGATRHLPRLLLLSRGVRRSPLRSGLVIHQKPAAPWRAGVSDPLNVNPRDRGRRPHVAEQGPGVSAAVVSRGLGVTQPHRPPHRASRPFPVILTWRYQPGFLSRPVSPCVSRGSFPREWLSLRSHVHVASENGGRGANSGVTPARTVRWVWGLRWTPAAGHGPLTWHVMPTRPRGLCPGPAAPLRAASPGSSDGREGLVVAFTSEP